MVARVWAFFLSGAYRAPLGDFNLFIPADIFLNALVGIFVMPAIPVLKPFPAILARMLGLGEMGAPLAVFQFQCDLCHVVATRVSATDI